MPTNHTTTVQLDFAVVSNLEAYEAIAALTEAAPDLTWRLLEAEGPTGWPLLECTVPTSQLEALMAAYEAD